MDNKNPGDVLKESSQILSRFFRVTQTDHPNGGHVFTTKKVTIFQPPKRSRPEEPGCGTGLFFLGGVIWSYKVGPYKL